jgi:hypothetical protein
MARSGGGDDCLSLGAVYDQGVRTSAFFKADGARAAADFQQTGFSMPNIRTANKNHKRTLAAQVARTVAAKKAVVEAVKPVKVAE